MKNIWVQIVMFFKNELKDKFMEALKGAFEAFKKTLWEEIRGEVVRVLGNLLNEAEEFKNSKELKEKEDKIINNVLDKIKLPLIAKPFKGLIRKMIKERIDYLIQDALNKGRDLIA